MASGSPTPVGVKQAPPPPVKSSSRVKIAPAAVAEYECGVNNGRIGTANSATLKRHPKMELSKNDMLRLLSYLEGELQAREIVIATLKSEKARAVLYQARYGRFGLGDPFMAIQRDSDGANDAPFDENTVKQQYENQLGQLEHLIAVQRRAQIKIRDQMKNAEVKYHQIHSELDDEKRKHAQDMAQGDDVTYALGKDRERLKDEIDFERAQNKKLEKEVKKLQQQFETEQTNSNKHKQVAIMLIKERRLMAEKLNLERRRSKMMEVNLLEERQKTKKMAEGLMQESRKALLMEATMEKQLSEFDIQSAQYQSKLAREEKTVRELSEELERCREELAKCQVDVERPREATQSIEIKTSAKPSGPPGAPREAFVVQMPEAPRPLQSPTSVRTVGGAPVSPRPDAHLAPQLPKPSPPSPQLVTSPVTPVTSDGYRVTLKSADAAPGTTFTVPVGGKVSVSLGGATSPHHRRSGRGVPPPVPPNKPTILPGGLVKRAADALERTTSP